ncbi:hypothetical protein [Paludisphaera soli]|uniref:hypothetical protein n=1 Tax=Paludisphaera soli TaxID=2712865 RepID=UPI0013ED6AA9|nr:hypothetical protein [Paludisphaera soli]
MADLANSRLKMIPADVRWFRSATCRAYEHHADLSRRICGCSTKAKGRMARERCPIGRFWV